MPAIALVLATAARAGTLDDMTLRSNVESSIRGNAQTAMLHLKIDAKDGTVTLIGRIHDLNQADDVVDLASKIKGVREIDRRGLQLEFAGPADAVIASEVVHQIDRVPKFASSGLRVSVESGVVTLAGAIKNAAWRRELRKLCGGIEGVVDVVDRLETPDTEDDRIQKVLDSIFGPRVRPPFPGHVTARVKNGTVTLEGRVPRLYDRRNAWREVWSINGVRVIDDLLELGSGTSIEVVRP
jgi:osmotically-inducible protein OsmY